MSVRLTDIELREASATLEGLGMPPCKKLRFEVHGVFEDGDKKGQEFGWWELRVYPVRNDREWICISPDEAEAILTAHAMQWAAEIEPKLTVVRYTYGEWEAFDQQSVAHSKNKGKKTRGHGGHGNALSAIARAVKTVKGESSGRAA